MKTEKIAFALLFTIGGMFLGALFGKLAFQQDMPNCPSCVCDQSAATEPAITRIVWNTDESVAASSAIATASASASAPAAPKRVASLKATTQGKPRSGPCNPEQARALQQALAKTRFGGCRHVAGHDEYDKPKLRACLKSFEARKKNLRAQLRQERANCGLSY